MPSPARESIPSLIAQVHSSGLKPLFIEHLVLFQRTLAVSQGFKPLADEWVHARCEFNKLNTESNNHDSLISPHQPRTKIPHHQASNCQILANSRITNRKNRILALRYLRPPPRQRRTIHQLSPDGTMEKCHCLSTAKMLHPATATTLVERN